MINWNLAQGNGFGNALQFGMQIGAQAAEAQERKEYRNALSTVFAPQQDPTSNGPYGTPGIGDEVGTQRQDPAARQQAMAVLAERNPQLYVRLQEREAAQQRQTQIGDAYRRVQAGDPSGLDDIFMLEPDLWKRLDDRQREGVKQSTSYLAQSAMQIGRLPADQRAGAWSQAVAAAEQNGMDIPSHLEAYSDQALNYALASAEKTEAYIKQFEPDWRAVPQGGYLENVNPLSNPTLGQGGPSAAASVAEGATATNPQTGEQVQYRNGAWVPMGGQTAQPSATFSGGFRGLDGERVTSTYRSPAKNRSVGGVRNSYHTRRYANGSPMARDSVPPPGMSMSAYAEALRRQNPNLEVINEGDHVHMEPRG